MQSMPRQAGALAAITPTGEITKMATWHQKQRPVPLYHATDWTVVIDPPNEMTHCYRTSTKALADVYMRNLRANNPRAAAHAFILKPTGKDTQ